MTTGFVIVKMDGTRQIIIGNRIGNIAGVADGYLYYIKMEGDSVFGETENQFLCKKAFSENGDLGSEILIWEVGGIKYHDNLGDVWIEGEWLYYTWSDECWEGNSRIYYRVKLDGTQMEEIV